MQANYFQSRKQNCISPDITSNNFNETRRNGYLEQLTGRRIIACLRSKQAGRSGSPAVSLVVIPNLGCMMNPILKKDDKNCTQPQIQHCQPPKLANITV